MKQAILIVAHKNPEQLKRLIGYFRGECEIYIHIDRRSEITRDEKEELRSLPGVKAVVSRYRVRWGGYSILRVEMLLLKLALKMGNAGYFHLISGQDYPIRPLSEFIDFFSRTRETGFISCTHLPHPITDGNTFLRVQYFFPADLMDVRGKEGRARMWRFVWWQKRHGLKRRLPDTFDHLYGGSAWFSISRELAKYIVDYTRRHPRFYRRMRHTYIPEEIYIPTVILNSDHKRKVVWNDNLRNIFWINEGLDDSPQNITEESFRILFRRPHAFFTRKMEYPQSLAAMDLIDQKLLVEPRPQSQFSEAGARCDTILRGYEYDNGLSTWLADFCRDRKLRTVCDFGCGPGWYVANLREKGIDAVGYDLNPNVEELGRMMTGGRDAGCFAQADLSEEAEADTPFDLLLFTSVGEYIPAEREATVIRNLRVNTARYLVVSWGSDRFREGVRNPHDPETVSRLITGCGDFVLNEVATDMARSRCYSDTHRRNILVFQKIPQT